MTFDLETARKLIWDASERKIWTPPGTTGYGCDIDKHRHWQAIIEICDRQFPAALAEIERLRAENLELQGEVFGPDGIRANQACIIADQAARISELEIEIAELKADLEQSERVIEARLDVIDQQAARIKELEDALVEELARGDYFDESQECEGYWWDRKNTSDCTQNDYRRNARLKLQAKGKIGPDADAKPRVWQITEERVEALQDAVNRYDVYDRCLVTHDRKVHVLGVLRAMLTEARQE